MNLLLNLFILLLTINQCLPKLLSWCDRALCPNGGYHTACNNYGYLGPLCPRDTVILETKRYKKFFLHAHNKRRNFIALGLVPGYYPASRMATMVWDNELAYLAGLNLKTCHLDHDSCANTYRFRNTGQCLAGLYSDPRNPFNMTTLIEQATNGWFREYKVIDKTYISRFRADSKFELYGHFAEMVIDRNTHVGCAAIRYTPPSYPYYHTVNIACNYASVYAIGVPVYRGGKPASKCRSGKNPFYPGLCLWLLEKQFCLSAPGSIILHKYFGRQFGYI